MPVSTPTWPATWDSSAFYIPSYFKHIDEPMIYLSLAQKKKVQTVPHNNYNFSQYADALPTWVCAKEVGRALNKDITAVDRAQAWLRNKPYMWATEFENVHEFWEFKEPVLIAPDGSVHVDSETYYQEVKSKQRIVDKEHVMFGALWLKFVHSAKRVELLNLLISTAPHPLLSIKPDRLYGYDPVHGGVNLLGTMLQNIRGIVMNKICSDRYYKTNDKAFEVAVQDSSQRIHNLYESYWDIHRPPQWAVKHYDDCEFRKNQATVTVFTLSQIDLNFYKVCQHRIPTNLGNANRYEGKDKSDCQNFLYQKYGYKQSGYQTVFEANNKQELGPNIALWCQTRYALTDQPAVKTTYLSFRATYATISVLNVIAFAFDSITQPDYIFFIRNNNMHLFMGHLVNVFRLMFKAWYRKPSSNSTLILSEFGSVAFTTYFPGGKEAYRNQYFYPALQSVWTEICAERRPQRIGLMGVPHEIQTSQSNSTSPHAMVETAPTNEQESLETLRTCCPGAGVFVCGLFPDIVSMQICRPYPNTRDQTWVVVEPSFKKPGPCIPLQDSMFVNSWDPHSIVGNGNASDPSIDGHFGRRTEMAALSFFGTNSKIQYEKV